MFAHHPAPEQAWIVRGSHAPLVLPATWKRLPHGACPVLVIRDAPPGRWLSPEVRFALDADGSLWCSELGELVVDDPVPLMSAARYAAAIVRNARPTTS